MEKNKDYLKGNITLNGKKYSVEVINGKRLIDGKTVEEFVKSLDTITVAELANVGFQALKDENNGTKTNSYQKMMDRFHQEKNN